MFHLLSAFATTVEQLGSYSFVTQSISLFVRLFLHRVEWPGVENDNHSLFASHRQGMPSAGPVIVGAISEFCHSSYQPIQRYCNDYT